MKKQSAIERFLSKIYTDLDDRSACWLWTAFKTPNGYGLFDKRGAHRFSYEYFVGPIPSGLDVSNVCRVRHCVNPKHLVAVTRKEAQKLGRGNGTKTHCAKGHKYSQTNTYRKGGRRLCRKCRRQNSQVHYQRNRTRRQAFLMGAPV